MKKFYPYFRYLAGVRSIFLSGVAAGIVFAVASGFGFPLMVKTVFPVIFGKQEKVMEVRETIAQDLGPEQADKLLNSAFEDEMTTYRQTEKLRGYFADKVGPENAPRAILIAACAVIPLAALIRGLAGFLNVYWITAAGLHVLREIQQSVFVKLQRLPLGFFSGRKTGDLISRVISDSNMLQGVVTTISNDLIKQPFTLIGALAFLVTDSVENRDSFFLLICLLSIPVVVVPIRFLGKRLMRKAAHMQRESGDNSAILAETLGATREIRAFNLEEMMGMRFLDGIARWTKFHLKVIKYRYLTPPIIEMVAAAVVAFALGYGASKGLSLERFMGVVTALYMCYDPMKKLGEIHNRMKQGEASLDRLEVILKAEEGVTDPPNPVHLGAVKGRVTFESVEFSYGDNPALHNMTLDVPAGQVVALVGPSGAGKTTFASLIPRFYDPTSGTIKLDGTPVSDLRLKDLRDHITIVPQEAVLFAGTIYENIRLGRMNATEDEVKEAARQAHAHDFIVGLPQGYDTQVGERGAQLSGGQKQRISIARAFLKNAPVLILDEATSALDAGAEARIQEELANLTKGRTTFIIAHRFSTIRIADRILVFEHGKIVGDGTFQELEAKHDMFRALLEMQRH
ncbi:ABC transporter ATP-binding protein/permease [Luteolibacter sp. GHJ8]|jgi:subfamily B ATP-binding cassette protein MsbA|uniref:ABC transporter ATP-binding protein/permease n=1 Tax=Luteolibacter rhizosphaerae TaxID=2989719 RepID=A0ABT3G7I1_9BACT|nr:ABC transporter ATP-binding protein [Luteolibacter rhizosphaerae]MCW1915816.1 ABC transporter ATP-binding protein/permease [Luteolibacter rhizosphaerae]